jgi:hypothetical protein
VPGTPALWRCVIRGAPPLSLPRPQDVHPCIDSATKFDFLITMQDDTQHKLKAESLPGLRRWLDALAAATANADGISTVVRKEAPLPCPPRHSPLLPGMTPASGPIPSHPAAGYSPLPLPRQAAVPARPSPCWLGRWRSPAIERGMR